MAQVFYKYAEELSKSEDKMFDVLHDPGEEAPQPGVYVCTKCKKPISIAGGHKLPPQNHHQHAASLGSIKWQLVVWG